MGTKRTIRKQGTRAVRCGAKAAVIRQAASIRSTQTAKRTKRAMEWAALCIHSPFGFSMFNYFSNQAIYPPTVGLGAQTRTSCKATAFLLFDPGSYAEITEVISRGS